MECNDGNVRQVMGVPYFPYDNISSRHLKKTLVDERQTERCQKSQPFQQ